jgi:hypothetical protein
LLADPKGLRLHAILDENVLRRSLADRGIMRDQLRHLLTASRRRNITIQIIPLSIGLYPGSETTLWSILDYPGSDGHPATLGFTEALLGGRTVERESDVNRLVTAFTGLVDLALKGAESRALIEQIIAEYDD